MHLDRKVGTNCLFFWPDICLSVFPVSCFQPMPWQYFLIICEIYNFIFMCHYFYFYSDMVHMTTKPTVKNHQDTILYLWKFYFVSHLCFARDSCIMTYVKSKDFDHVRKFHFKPTPPPRKSVFDMISWSLHQTNVRRNNAFVRGEPVT